MGILKFAYRGETKVKLAVDTTRVAPVSAKPPPPAPPSKYSRVMAAEQGAEKGKQKIPKERRTKEQKANESPKEERHWGK